MLHPIIRGSTPRFPPWDFLFCGKGPKKASREGPNLQRNTARPRLRIADPLSHWCCGRLRPTLELRPLERGNRYMSQRRGMTHTNAHAPTLAEFWFPLILVSSSCVAPPTEMNFHLLASYARNCSTQPGPTCKLLTIPIPKAMILNGTSGLRVHRR